MPRVETEMLRIARESKAMDIVLKEIKRIEAFIESQNDEVNTSGSYLLSNINLATINIIIDYINNDLGLYVRKYYHLGECYIEIFWDKPYELKKKEFEKSYNITIIIIILLVIIIFIKTIL